MAFRLEETARAGTESAQKMEQTNATAAKGCRAAEEPTWDLSHAINKH